MPLLENRGPNHGNGGAGDEGNGQLHDPLGSFVVSVKRIVRSLQLTAEGIKPLIHIGSELIDIKRDLIQLVCQVS